MKINDVLKNRYLKGAVKDRKLILSIMLAVFIPSMLYLALLYKPLYKSEAKIWIKNISEQSFVGSYQYDNPNQPLTLTGNPILTQMEILHSFNIRSFLADYIDEKYPKMLKGVKNKEKTVGNLYKTDNKAGTDIIDISLKADSPEKSREILSKLLEKYNSTNLIISRQLATQRRQYIDNQVVEIQNRLNDARQKLKDYKQGTLAINLHNEVIALVNQKIEFKSQLETLRAEINNTQNRVNSLEEQLALNTDDAIKAVALGSENENLTRLRNSLNETNLQYVHDSVKMAETNPRMVALKKQINTLEDQIFQQVKLTLGENSEKIGINILDPVRSKMVDDLVSYQTALSGLKAQAQSLRNSIARIEKYESELPAKEYNLNTLQQEVNNLSSAYDELKTRQIEAKIKEAEVASNIAIVDDPILPIEKSFPKAVHVFIMSLMLGTIFGVGGSCLKTNLEDKCENGRCVEKVTKSPVLGTIPWMRNVNDPEQRSIMAASYKKIISNLLHNKSGLKVLTFTSSSVKKRKPLFVYNLALQLRQLGHSVAIVDADLKKPSLFKLKREGHEVELSTVMDKISSKLSNNEEVPSEQILNCLYSDQQGIQFIGNEKPMESSYEYFCSDAFKVIVDTLKENFDWVLVEAPSVRVSPEFDFISRLSDGIVLFANHGINHSTLKGTFELLKTHDTPFLGTVIREEDTLFEKDFNEAMSSIRTSLAQFKEEVCKTKVGSGAKSKD